MLQECLLSGVVVRKPTSDLLLHLLSNPILRDHHTSVAAILPSVPYKQSSWASQSSSTMETQSFTARRSAANSLPTFSLPPPDHLSQMHRLPAYAPSSSTQPTPAIISSVLTPPAGLASDLSPSVNSGSSQSSAGGVPPYQPMGFWPTPNQPSYGFSSAPSMPTAFAQTQQPYMGRQLYSPSMNYPSRNANSPSVNEGLPPPPYEISAPSFPAPMSGGGHLQHQTLPALTTSHHQQNQHQNHQQHMNHLPAASQAPPQGPLHAPDTCGGRPPPTPSYYTPASTPQQSSFPAYPQQSPTQQSPNISSAPSHRISPVSAHSHSSMAAPQGYPRPYSGYNLPAMAGPIMSNMHNPGNQMALVGGMNMQGYPQHPHQMHGYPPHGQAPVNDRPFKCDQCPQSFNRNHDLKRHKRIHLAVKPFPCGNCEKSFSRKDALKRHILVKGCGKGPGAASNTNGGSLSPIDKDGIMSDSTDDSPEMPKKELL
ncbi:related to finger protein [Rhynchosporium secalis]|uniref:Related to finger protein n=1 Tax=Rhynchosporium secalis TaxID=38038 RepID=A0A1E1MF90_RHYSE|nr:related to finger protein [Rhynchosporium secalis]